MASDPSPRMLLEGSAPASLLTPAPQNSALPAAIRGLADFLGHDLGEVAVEAHGRKWGVSRIVILAMAALGEAFRFPGFRTLDGVVGQGRPTWTLASLTGSFAAARLGVRIIAGPEIATRSQACELVRATLAGQSKPLLAMDVPIPGSVFLAAGYDDAGGVLLGWAFTPGGDNARQPDPTRVGYLGNWTDSLSAIVVPTDASPDVAGSDSIALLKTAPAEMMGREWAGCLSGPAMFEAWADAVADPSLDADDAATLARRANLVEPWIWSLAERRWYAGLFIREVIASGKGDGSRLAAIADKCQAIHDLMWKLSVACRDGKPEGRGELASPSARGQSSAIIREAMKLDHAIAQDLTDLFP